MRSQASQSNTMGPVTHRISIVNIHSSAFSASANPNEDWTKITDLAERRRIQNRIAQRNYRKKLKKRLEDLERRANSTSASPEPEAHQDDSQDSVFYSTLQARRSPSLARAGRSHGYPELSYDTVSPSGDDTAKSPYFYGRQPSTPPQFHPSAYTASESRPYSSHQQSASYQFQPMSPPELPMYGTYLSPGISAAQKSETAPIKSEYFDEDFKSFSMTYAPATGSSMSSTQGYFDSSLNTPPLSDCFNFDYLDASMTDSLPGTPPELFGNLFPPTPDLFESDSPAFYFT